MDLPHELIGEFLDAVVEHPAKADAMLRERPELLNARWIHDETALHFLAIEGFVDAVRFLAVRGADVNAVNEFGDTALVDIAALGHTEVAAVLLSHGADPNAKSVVRENPLHAAARAGHAALVRSLDQGRVPSKQSAAGRAHRDLVDKGGIPTGIEGFAVKRVLQLGPGPSPTTGVWKRPARSPFMTEDGARP